MQQLLGKETVESGRRLLSALVKLTNLFLLGCVPGVAFYGAGLCALEKKGGGVRPIAVGSLYRRLACRIAARHGTGLTRNALKPIQLGVGVSQGCEIAIHGCREYISNSIANPNCNKVLVTLDIRNAFNTVHRDVMLTELGT